MNLAQTKRLRRMCEKIAWQLGWEARGVNSGADHFEQLHGNNLGRPESWVAEPRGPGSWARGSHSYLVFLVIAVLVLYDLSRIV